MESGTASPEGAHQPPAINCPRRRLMFSTSVSCHCAALCSRGSLGPCFLHPASSVFVLSFRDARESGVGLESELVGSVGLGLSHGIRGVVGHIEWVVNRRGVVKTGISCADR